MVFGAVTASFHRADVLNFAWILLLNVLLQAMPTASMDGCALYFGALDVLLPP